MPTRRLSEYRRRPRRGSTAALRSHNVFLERFASNGDRISVSPGIKIGLGETIRLVTDGVQNGTINPPEFVIIDTATDATVLRRDFGGGAVASGNVWVDVQAPNYPGTFALKAHAQTYPFLPVTHESDTFIFRTSDSPDPLPEGTPCQGPFCDFKFDKLVTASIVIAVAYVAGQGIGLAKTVTPRR